tara:strand:+ start:125 stop:535 length:411 start_codon:yes stop_codon:yes gene_type:complete
MVKCKISIKNTDPKARYLLLPCKKKDYDNFLKETKVNLDLITYNDFDYDLDEYVEKEVKVIKSEAEFKYNNIKDEMFISLENAIIELEFESEDQEERFIDKDWEYESFTFTLDLKGPNSNDFINYTDSELFSLEII